MAYSFTSASSQYISAGSAPITAAPLTLFARANPTNLTNWNALLGLGASGSSNNFRIEMDGTTASDPLIFVVTGASSGLAQVNNFSAGAWQTGAGVTSGVSSRFAYLNTSKSAQNTASTTPSGIDRLSIGALVRSTVAGYTQGSIADAAIWSVALNDDEIAALSKGFKPSRIRPQSLVFYAPLIRNLQDLRGGLALTNNNGATASNHPRVY